MKALLLNLFTAPDPQRPGHRLRAGWRILGHLALLIVLTFVASLPARLLPSSAMLDNVLQAFSVLVITVSVFIARRWLDHRSIRSLGLDTSPSSGWDLLAGFGIAGAMMGAIFLIEWLFGWMQIQGVAPVSQILPALGMLLVWIAVGWYEELYFRGYLLQNLEDGLNIGWALSLSSLLFALAHLGNPNVNSLTVAGLLLSGLFLALGYLRTRRLWLSIGLHTGWNFFEGTVFGFPVSGINVGHLIRQSATGPQTITGGAFGPEAGLVLIAGLVVGTALIFLYPGSSKPSTVNSKYRITQMNTDKRG